MAESDVPSRWPMIALGGAILVLVIFLVARSKTSGSAASDVDAGSSESAAAVLADAASTTTSAAADASDPLGLGAFGELGASQPTEREDRLDSGIGSLLPDGTPVPPLPEKAPRSVRFGVILVSYTGAQGAPPNARSKREGKELADKLAAEAKTDFHAAVGHGDSGSSDDLGRIPRGTLELAPEYVLFTMASGQTSEPIDTPRGFWIVKRID